MEKPPLVATIGTAVILTLAIAEVQAEVNPFATNAMPSGYMQLAADHNAKSGERALTRTEQDKKLLAEYDQEQADIARAKMDAKAKAAWEKKILGADDEEDARLKVEAKAARYKRMLAADDEEDAQLNQQDLVTNWPEAIATSVLHKTNTALNAAGIAGSYIPEFFSNRGTDIQQGWHDLTNAEGERPEDTDYWKKVRDRGRANKDSGDERYRRAKVAENYPATDFIIDPILVGEIALTGPTGLARKGLSKAAISTLKKQAAAQATTKGPLKDMIMDKTKRALMNKKKWSDARKSFALGATAEGARNTTEDDQGDNAFGGGIFNVVAGKVMPPIGKAIGGLSKSLMGTNTVQGIVGAIPAIARRAGKLEPKAAPKFDNVDEEDFYNIIVQNDFDPVVLKPPMKEGIIKNLLTAKPVTAIAKKLEDMLPTPNRHLSPFENDRGIRNFKSKNGQRLVDEVLRVAKPAYRKEAWARGDREKEEGLRKQRMYEQLMNMQTVR